MKLGHPRAAATSARRSCSSSTTSVRSSRPAPGSASRSPAWRCATCRGACRRAGPRGAHPRRRRGRQRPRRRRRGRGHRRHRAGPRADPRRAVRTASRWSRPTRSCWPTSAPSCSTRPRPPGSTCSSRRRSAGASPSSGRCASRWSVSRITRVIGIVNGTTNFILTRMTEEGVGYAEALAEAQSLGYAERDPTADVEGFDAGAKAAIMASIAFGVRRSWPATCTTRASRASPPPTSTSPPASATSSSCWPSASRSRRRRARDRGARPSGDGARHPPAGRRPRQLQRGVRRGRRGRRPHVLRARGRRRRPPRRPCSATSSTPRSTSARGPTPASATLGRGGHPPDRRAVVAPSTSTSRSSTGPACCARWPRCSSEHAVSIRSMEQEGLGEGARIIFITHVAREADVQATLRDLRGLDVVAPRRQRAAGHRRRRRRPDARSRPCSTSAPAGRPPSWGSATSLLDRARPRRRPLRARGVAHAARRRRPRRLRRGRGRRSCGPFVEG